MSQSTELLDQFINEARDCLERVGELLLEVERAPADRALLDDLFRQVHTLKGNCGLFELAPMERVVHAGEDVLDQVRSGALGYSVSIADALLDAMDFTSELVDELERHGHLEQADDERSERLAARLRVTLAPPPTEPTTANPTSEPGQPPEPASWRGRLPGNCASLLAIRYVPEPDCFFKGEDPWHLVVSSPGLAGLDVLPLARWTEDFDCYRANLDFVLACDAPESAVREHFRYVSDQIELDAPAAGIQAPAPHPNPGRTRYDTRLKSLWQEQQRLLTESRSPEPATVASARNVFDALLTCQDDAEAERARNALRSLAGDLRSLVSWSHDHDPSGTPDPGGRAPEPASAATPDAEIEERRAASDEHERVQRVLKISQEKIDQLMDLIGEMVVAKNSLPFLADRAENVYQQRELAREIKAHFTVINRVAEDMQHAIMQIRMLPVGNVMRRFARVARDIGRRLGKEVDLIIEGEETEADKNVVESLADPLLHLLRNSLDHGLETPEQRVAAGKPARGTLRITARQEGDRVVLEIADDGAGIDAEKVRNRAVERGLVPADRAATLNDAEARQLIFLPGFSTAERVSDLSGRGVGMDVVRSAIERVNGSISLTSSPGAGTTVTLSLPLSIAVTNVMMIETGGNRYGVPMDLIAETVRVPGRSIQGIKHARTVVLRGRLLPVIALAELLALDTQPRANADGEYALLVVHAPGGDIALIVDDFLGTSDIILKPLEGVLSGMAGLAGTAIMGDGSVLMILSPKELV